LTLLCDKQLPDYITERDPDMRNILIFGIMVLCAALSPAADPAPGEILKSTGITGGVIVHVGCGDGSLAAGLVGPGFVVQGLDIDAADVEKTRAALKAKGGYGINCAAVFDGKRLPYAENVVNLLVISEPGDLGAQEIMRVLVPDGAAYAHKGGKWEVTRKPRPENTDEWTHYLYDASNNAVSRDEAVGPPGSLQWVAAPKFSRSHEHLASLSAAVIAQGRVFAIEDHGPVESVAFPAKWMLVARDAFNGVTLWRRELGPWEWHLREFRHGPPEITRRLVAVGDRVFATLSYGGPVEILDAATGKTLKTLAGTNGAEEIIHIDGVLLLAIGDTKPAKGRDARKGAAAGLPRRVLAINAKSGKTLWQHEAAKLAPVTLGAADNRVFFQDGACIIALNLSSGDKHWQSEALSAGTKRASWFSPVVVAYRDMILWADAKMLTGLEAATGKQVWKGRAEVNWHAPPDVLVAGGLVWTGQLRVHKQPGITKGLDPKTGEVKSTRPPDQKTFDCGMTHHRCYRNKATEKWLLLGRAGTEFQNVKSGEIFPNHWVRGMCQYGVLPANGLLYAPPHACACFLTAKINGFNALAPRRAGFQPGGEPLERGPAYGKVAESKAGEAAWPTYRHDARRSGQASTKVTTALKQLWKAKVGSKLTAITVAGGMCLVADCDAHTIHALDEKTGKPVWTFTATGRVDCPPTIAGGYAVFGSRDGHVYCLRASDGALAWRFRAAPADRRVVCYGQLESLWPVRGSVLVQDGTAVFAAGRSSFLDGGIRLCRVELKTGKLLGEHTIYTPDPGTHAMKRKTVYGFNMYGALPDVMAGDGETLFMRQLCFTPDLKPAPAKPHLFSPTGLLDDSWWHRTYWLYGQSFTAGWPGWFKTGNQVPAGRILAFNNEAVFGFGRTQFSNRSRQAGQNWAAQEQFHIFAAGKVSKPAAPPKAGAKKRRGRGPATRKNLWSHKAPVRARAMVLTKETVFFAGVPNLGNSSPDAFSAMRGQKGAKLVAVSTADGANKAAMTLPALPVLDGMAAANGRLYIALRDGSIVCLGG
jgi:outer membrane protein assembly factor BamB